MIQPRKTTFDQLKTLIITCNQPHTLHLKTNSIRKITKTEDKSKTIKVK